MYWINSLSRGVPRAFPMCILQTIAHLTAYEAPGLRGISYWLYSNVNNINFYEHKPIHSGPCLTFASGGERFQLANDSE